MQISCNMLQSSKLLHFRPKLLQKTQHFSKEALEINVCTQNKLSLSAVLA